MICKYCQHERTKDDEDNLSISPLICPSCKMPYEKKRTSPEVFERLRSEISQKSKLKNQTDKQENMPKFKAEAFEKLINLGKWLMIAVFVGVLLHFSSETKDIPEAGYQIRETLTRWNYNQQEDKMGRGTIRTATVLSINKVNFGFPYQGDEHGTLMLRDHPAFGREIIFSIEKGQFMCHLDGCAINVRFDNDESEIYQAAGTNDNSTDTLFIRGHDAFVSKIKHSKKLLIEAVFYQEDSRVFEFNVSGLNCIHSC